MTLLGRRVTIEATPTAYTWHFGADTADAERLSRATPVPPTRTSAVTYRYTRVGMAHPSVDTTYSGRYRVGGGAWRTIPQTLTVTGAAVDLEVVSATPHLVGYRPPSVGRSTAARFAGGYRSLLPRFRDGARLNQRTKVAGSASSTSG